MHKNLIRLIYGLLYTAPVFLLALTACGGGGGSTGTTTGVISYLLKGTTSGLTSPGLILSSSGVSVIEDIVVSGAASGVVGFEFINPIIAGDSYSITVKTNPSSPPQRCAVTASASSVAMTSDVTDVVVSCDYRTIGGIVNIPISTFYELEMSSNLGETISVSGIGVVPYAFARKYADGDFYETKVRAASGVCAALSLTPIITIDSVSKVIATGTIASDVTVSDITCF